MASAEFVVHITDLVDVPRAVAELQKALERTKDEQTLVHLREAMRLLTTRVETQD